MAVDPISLVGLPAILGGEPAFPEGLPLARPETCIGPPQDVAARLDAVLRSGVLTNGPLVRELEERAADYLGVRHCIAVASCTAGLMLVLRAAGLTGDVVVPSFTFVATAHAVAWNGLRPVFADVDERTLTLSASGALRVAGVRTIAILATHTYGTPSDIEGLTELATSNGMRLFFDAAHAFGAEHRGRKVGGFGDAEVFSLSPTKGLVAAEGGIIATEDDALAQRCRIGRDYGNPGDYDARLIGLNARMSELHAAVALSSLEGLDERTEVRNGLADRYRALLGEIPGVSFPEVPEGDRSTYKDFTILVEPAAFGMTAADLVRALEADGVETRRYYHPPVHAQRAYRHIPAPDGRLPVTEAAAARVVSIPLWVGMTAAQQERLALALQRIHQHTRANSPQPEGWPLARREAP